MFHKLYNKLFPKRTIIRCAVCDAVCPADTLGLYDYMLCTKHSDMARGAFLWVKCKIEHDLSNADAINLADAVIHCLKET